MLDTPWKPAKDTELILSLVAAVQAHHWPVLESISLPEQFSKAWDFYLLVRTSFWQHLLVCMHGTCRKATPQHLPEAWKPQQQSSLRYLKGIEASQAPSQGMSAVSGPVQGKQTAASLQVKRSPRTRSATKKRDSHVEG